MVIAEPNALIAFDTPRIIVAPGAGEGPSVEVAQWRDNIPKLIQAKLVESFENANYLAAAAREILGENGKIIGSHTFDAIVPVRETGTPGAVAALNEAFRTVAVDLVVRTRGAV